MKNIVCVIDIGSSAIRLVILEVAEDGKYRQLDRASRPVSLGRDVFMSRSIKAESIKQVSQILMSFAEMLKAWHISPEQAHVVATSAVRESRNREIFVDRIQTKTNFRIQILDGVEENHLTYIAVQHAIKNFHTSLAQKNSIIVEVGGGTTELMIMQKGKMQATLNLKVGTLRLEQQLKNQPDSRAGLEDFLIKELRPSIANLCTDSKLQNIHYFIMVGGGARVAAHKIGKPQDEHYSLIQRNDFLAWVENLQTMTVEEIVTNLDIGYNEADGLLPASLIFKLFMQETSASEIIVPDVRLRDGILLRNVIGQSSVLDQDFASQVVASAQSLGQRYHINEEHSLRVKNISLTLYDHISSEYRLDNRYRLYLEVSAILHSVGYFINRSGYHKHGQYIVTHSDIFGLTQEEIQIVANVVCYHRGAVPIGSHPQFATLSVKQRLVVMKLAAILRVAIALAQDMSVKKPTVEKKGSTIFISGEQHLFSLNSKLRLRSSLFEEVFGYRVLFR